MRKTKLEIVLEFLRSETERLENGNGSVFVSQGVQNPVDLLQHSMDVHRVTALGYLKELELKGVVSLDRNGNSIVSVRVLKDELPAPLYEKSEEERIIEALAKYKKPSELSSDRFVVHAHIFDLVRKAADISQPRFYVFLHEFEESGWIKIHYALRRGKRSNKIQYVVLLEDFPHPQE